MTLTHILSFVLAALAYHLLIPASWRGWVLVIGSVIVVYWLQPALPIRRLDFILPTLTLSLTILIWVITAQTPIQREDRLTLVMVGIILIVLSLTRYLIPALRPTPSYPPGLVTIFLILAGMLLLIVLLNYLKRYQKILVLALLLLVGMFIILKTENLAEQLSRTLRDFTGQSVDLADASDLRWLGFSYVAFRLIHLLRDRQSGILPPMTLREHLTYVIFFPALTAGPIDRAERFLSDARQLDTLQSFQAPRWVEGIMRIVIGIFKKFALADSLALLALTETSAAQTHSGFALLILLYAYTFQLYLDFSGYTDIAIGIGILFGFQLPENFDRPYLKDSITAFWQSWHMTLSNWVRFYVFSPLSRFMLRMKPRPSGRIIVLITQLATMITIGMWHGITWNFLIWGVWHGLGLFIHKIWSDLTRPYVIRWAERPHLLQVWSLAGTVITFHFVVVGWIWFALPDMNLANEVFLKILGLG
jgi:D-alanyl-lipoteichoic acid acyltransferase DltB (MBOAT superfamily)